MANSYVIITESRNNYLIKHTGNLWVLFRKNREYAIVGFGIPQKTSRGIKPVSKLREVEQLQGNQVFFYRNPVDIMEKASDQEIVTVTAKTSRVTNILKLQ